MVNVSLPRVPPRDTGLLEADISDTIFCRALSSPPRGLVCAKTISPGTYSPCCWMGRQIHTPNTRKSWQTND